MQVSIKSRWNEAVLFEGEYETRKAAVEAASKQGADLGGADLRDADLGGANLRDADLGGADLRGAYLEGANLTTIRDDVWAVLSASPAEVPALRKALLDGTVDGSTYERTVDGKTCGCLVGTLKIAAHGAERPLLKGNLSRPAERFFMGIALGDKPACAGGASLVCDIALEWIDTWLTNVRAAIPALGVDVGE